MNVTGTSSSLSHQVTVQVNINSLQDYTISSSPTSVTVDASSQSGSKITITAVNGFTGTVALSQNVGPSCSLSSSIVTLTLISPSNSVTLSCTFTSSGIKQVIVTRNSGTITHSTTVTFTVQDFSIGANPTAITVTVNQAGTSNITIIGLDGFNGFVSLTASASFASISASLNPTSVTGSGSSTLTVSGSTPGTYSVTIMGTGGSLSHNVTVSVNIVGSQDFQISANPTTIIIYASGTNRSIVSITPINNFTANVSLAATLPTGFSAIFSNNPVAAGSTSAMTVSAASSVAVGTYTITVAGTSGSLTHSVNVSVSVLAKPSIALVALVPVTGTSSNTATTSSMKYTKGDLIVVYVSVGAGQTITSIVDSGSPSSTYDRTVSAVNGNTILYLYTATAATNTNNTITITISAAGYVQLSAAEYSGVVGFGALNTSTGASTTPTVSLTTQNANSWVIVGYGWTGSGTHSGDTGFTDRHAGSIGTQHLDYGDTNAAKPIGTYTYTGTLSQSDPWAMISLELI